MKRPLRLTKNGLKRGCLMSSLFVGLFFASLVSLYISRLYFAIEHTSAIRQALIQYSGDSHYTKKTRDQEKPVVIINTTNPYAAITNEHEPPRSLERSETKIEVIARLYPNETQIANPPLQDGNTTFAACMLVMDDNHRLTEWMAYHYHVLPLRYMIVAVDPRSKTAPTHILNQWRARGVHIIEWNDRDFWRADLKLVPIPDDAEIQTKRDRHRGRQKYFYKQCLIRCKKDRRTWVSLHDSDEYLVYNHAGGEKFKEWEARRVKTSRMPRIQPSQTPPTTADAGAMIRYINQERAAGLKYYQSPCIGVPRTMFGADETQVDKKAIVRQVPESFHWAVPHMDSLKYRQHATRNDFVKNALGKVIIDVSRVDVARTPYFMSLHRPIKKLCPTPWINDWNAGLRINHYLGSWDSYSFRDDSRRGNERSWEQWTYKATTLGENTDDNIRPWLSGLIENEGEEIAADMLKDVGLPANYKNGDDYKWHLIPERLHEILSTDETIKQDNKAVAFEDWVRHIYRSYPEMVEQRKLDYEKIRSEQGIAAASNSDVSPENEDYDESNEENEPDDMEEDLQDDEVVESKPDKAESDKIETQSIQQKMITGSEHAIDSDHREKDTLNKSDYADHGISTSDKVAGQDQNDDDTGSETNHDDGKSGVQTGIHVENEKDNVIVIAEDEQKIINDDESEEEDEGDSSLLGGSESDVVSTE